MQKSLVLTLVIIALAIVAGVATFLYGGHDKEGGHGGSSTTSHEDTPGEPDDREPDVSASVSNDKHLQGANMGETVDATSQSAVAVAVDDFIFKTTTLKVKKGTVVTWTNQGRVQHDVISATNSPKQGLSSEMLSNGETYSFTFNETGTYQYFCSPHPTQMRAIVEVVE